MPTPMFLPWYERLKASGIQLPASLFQTIVEIGEG